MNYEISKENIQIIFKEIRSFLKKLNKSNVDIIVGGPPCQAYSLAGRSADTNRMKDDHRNYLYKEYAKFLIEFRPKLFVFGSRDLSRRAVVLRMFGMSFREFIEFELGIDLKSSGLKDIIGNHQRIADGIVTAVEKKGKKVLALFKSYLQHGYYPYFREYKNRDLFYLTLEQNIHTTLESDLIAIYPALSGNSVKKIKKLLTIIASSVPFTPDLKKLKTMLEVGDERTLKTYIKYLEDAGIILTVSKGSRGLRQLEKPEKIYLNNTNLIHAISGNVPAEIGNLRETFFLNMTGAFHKVSCPAYGDFLIDGKYLFEIGGKNKDFSQIKNIRNSFLAIDNIELGVGNKIPLWVFGLLY